MDLWIGADDVDDVDVRGGGGVGGENDGLVVSPTPALVPWVRVANDDDSPRPMSGLGL